MSDAGIAAQKDAAVRRHVGEAGADRQADVLLVTKARRLGLFPLVGQRRGEPDAIGAADAGDAPFRRGVRCLHDRFAVVGGGHWRCPYGFALIPLVLNRETILSILKVSIQQIKAARALLGWSQETLAEKSGVSWPTIKRLEADAEGPIGGRSTTATALKGTLESAGIEFIDEGSGSAKGGGQGVRLKVKAGSK